MALGKKADIDADTKPGFYRQDSAASNLSNLESNAANANIDDSADTVEGTRGAEGNPDDDFTNAVVGDDEKSNKKGGFFKKKGPIMSIMLLLLGVGGVTLGSQSLMPFSLIEQFRETYDSITTSTNLRSKTFLKLQLENKEIENPIAKKYFGIAGEDVFKISEKQKTKLAKQGIYVEEDFGGTGKTAMLFDDGTGSLKVVAANSDAAELFKGVGDVGEIHGMKVDVSDAMDFEMKFEASGDFRNGYIKSSRTWRGAVGAWFDSITLKFLDSNSITRNRFKDFRDKVNSEANGNTRQEAIELMNKTKDVSNSLGEMGAKYEYEYEVEENGKTVKKTVELEMEYDAANKQWISTTEGFENITVKESEARDLIDFGKIGGDAEIGKPMSKDDAKTMIDGAKKASGVEKVSSIANTGANLVCAAFNVMGSINLLVAAHEGLQIIQLVTGYFEAIDKVKAGDGADSPINDLANGLTIPMATTKEEGNENETETVVIPGHENMTAMQSAGITSLYANTGINPEDEGVENFAMGSRINSIFDELSVSVESFAACAFAKMATAIVSAAIDVITIASCFTPAFIICITKEIGGLMGNIALSISLAGVVSVALGKIVPFATKVLTRDLISDLAGEDLGNALMSGANMYMGNNHRSGGGSLTTAEKYAEFKAKQQDVIAEEARYQRETRSPFDVTSQYTFMGSLMKQVVTLSTISSGPMNTLKGIGNIMSNSITSLLPSAFAVDLVDTMPNPDTYAEYCPYLAGIGAIGDAYCNPYIISDINTAFAADADSEFSPEKVVEKVVEYGGLNNDENDTEFGEIIEDSKLAKYITYCNGRSSQFGVADTNIASHFTDDVDTSSDAFNTVTNGAIGAIPVIGDLIDTISNGRQLANLGWISGQSCVAGEYDEESVGSDAIMWEEGQYYQRFIEDQRLLESMQDDYESVVSSYLDKYYMENPVDDSYEAILARHSGLKKEVVVAILDYVEYQDYVANYHPEIRYAFEEYKPEEKILIEKNEEHTVLAIMRNNIEYDYKQRNFAIV